jgi:lipopolysaccharide cholinephosphotransferase
MNDPQTKRGHWRPATSEDVRRVLVDGLEALERHARATDISYVLIAGSALGARRHSGPIPWDDDIDVCMEREDFLAFCRAPLQDYPVDTRATDPVIGSDAKFYLPATRLERPFGDAHNFVPPSNGGAFIDIFCFYRASTKRWVRQLERALGWVVYVRPWGWALATSRQPVGFARRLRHLAAATVPRRVLARVEQHLWNRSTRRTSSLRGIGIGGVNGRVFYPADHIWPAKRSEFHGMAARVPNMLDDFLVLTFGQDFMTPLADVSDSGHGDFLVWTDESRGAR